MDFAPVHPNYPFMMRDRVPAPPGIQTLASLVTPGFRLDHPQERWVAIAGLMTLELCLSELVALLLYAVVAPAALPWIAFIPALHLLVVPLVRRRRVELSLHWNCVLLWCYCICVGHATGGAGTIGMLPLTSIPFVPIAMLHYRATAVWMGIVSVTGLLCYHPSVHAVYAGPGLAEGYEAFGAFAITALISSVGLAVIWQVAFVSAGYADQLVDAMEEVENAKGQAVAANEAKDVFLASMSHELRTPMNGVVGVTGLLLETPLNAEQRGYATTLRHSATALLDIVNEVLDFARIEADMLTLDPRPTRPVDIVEQVAGVVGVSAAAKGLEVQVSVDTTVPEFIMVDPGRLRQVLYNLLGNAVKFTDRGTVSVRVVSTSAPGGLCISVSDTGPGIPAEMLPTIFDRFVRVGTSGMGRPGTGLGLAIARGLVDVMGGELTVESELGYGTTFSVLLTVESVAAPDDASADDSMLADARFDLRVLLAEDNLVNQRVAMAMLTRLGCQVEVVADGAAAVEIARQMPFDLIFMDCEMPGMDGFQASRGVRGLTGRRGRLPIVALTAHVLPDARERCFDAGMDDFVSKPVTLQMFRATLARWCPDGVRHAKPEAEPEPV